MAILAAAFLMVAGLTGMMTGDPMPGPAAVPASPRPAGVPDDWSFHHLIYSNPGTYDQVKNDPAAYSKWLKIQYDTRYILQEMKRNHTSAGGYSPR